MERGEEEPGPRPFAPDAVIGSAALNALDLIGLSVRLGGRTTLEDVDLSVRDGEILGLIGREGAGKSVLLRAVAGRIASSAGAIRVQGAPLRPSERRARLAYLPDRFRPPVELSGHEFLRVALLMHGGTLDPAVVRDLARSLDLDPADLARPGAGRGKEVAQKLGLLALLLSGCPLLLLDEPMCGLAPDARAKVKRALSAAREQGRTILLASHIPQDHEDLCDRIAVLRSGRLAYVGAIDDLCRQRGAPTLTTALRAEPEGARQSGGLNRPD